MKCFVRTVSFCLVAAVVCLTTAARADTFAFTYSDTAGNAAYGQITAVATTGDIEWGTGGYMNVTASGGTLNGPGCGLYDLETLNGTTTIGSGVVDKFGD